MSDTDEDQFQREMLIEEKLLHTEYQEVNQEFRHRNQLLHNTFYLFVISSGVFLGLLLRVWSDGDAVVLGSITIASGAVSTIIGHLFLKHFHERSSAEVVRMHAEWVANGKREKSDRVFSLEHGVAGGGAIYDKERDRIVRRGSHVHYITKWPQQLLSAEFLGLILIYFGAIALVVGILLISSIVVSGLSLLFIGAVTVTALVVSYIFVIKKTPSPGEKSIY